MDQVKFVEDSLLNSLKIVFHKIWSICKYFVSYMYRWSIYMKLFYMKLFQRFSFWC